MTERGGGGPPMSESEKDELIEAQKQVIGILFEVVKRLQANNDLDDEYFGIVTGDSPGGDGARKDGRDRIDKIMSKRKENSRIVGNLLDQLQV